MVDQLNRMTSENKELHDELRNGQEKLRLSNQQHNQLITELNEFRNRVSLGSQESEDFKRRINNLLQ